MILEVIQEQIKKSFFKALDRYFEMAANYLGEYDDSMEAASESVIKEIEEKFDDYNNSTWIDPEDENFDQKKEQILDFIRTL